MNIYIPCKETMSKCFIMIGLICKYLAATCLMRFKPIIKLSSNDYFATYVYLTIPCLASHSRIRVVITAIVNC